MRQIESPLKRILSKKTSDPSFIKMISLLCLIIYGTNSLYAQPDLSADGQTHTINYDDDYDWYQYKIPADVGNLTELEFTLNGGDGGRRVVAGLCKKKGGEGATANITFSIGTGPGQLEPGGILRFIVGQRGENKKCGCIEGAGGGGGTAILYKAPGADITCEDHPSLDINDANSCFVLLGVAGGGGGAYASGLCDGESGKGGRSGTSGSSGSGSFGGNPGTNGGGGSGTYGGGGGGYLQDGDSYSGGNKGGLDGGNGGEPDSFFGTGVYGGFGYGGGGGTNEAGGGGGGFSGGGGGDRYRSGGGGGSFANASALVSNIQGGGTTKTPNSGYIKYRLREASFTAPVAICQTIVAELNQNGQVVINAEDQNGGSYSPIGEPLDYCYLVGSIFTGFSCLETFTFDCDDLGELEMFLVVTDGNEGSYCYGTVQVEDNILPTALCKPTLSITPDASGIATISGQDLDDGSYDNCGIVSYTSSHETFDCSETGNYNVTLTVTDADDNSSSCTTVVSVVPYEFECAPDFCVNIPEGQSQVWVDIPDVLLESNCGYWTTNRVCNSDFSNCSSIDTEDKSGYYGAGDYFVQYILHNPNGAIIGACFTYFTVFSNTLECAPDFSVTIPVGDCDVWVDIPDVLAEPGCGYWTTNRVCKIDFSDCSSIDTENKSGYYEAGDYFVQYILHNPNGAIINACFTYFTVISSETLPTALCKNITVQLDGFGQASITATDVDNNSYDACSSLTLSASPITFNCSDIGNQSVTLTATNEDGNSNTCTATVTVEDNVSPDMSCQNTTVQLDASGNGSITVSDIDNGSSDACGIQDLSLSQTSFDCTEVGTQSVTLTGTDVNGNSNTCTATVTVEDNVSPDMSCQNTTVQLDDFGNGSITVADIDNGSSDACGIQDLILSQTSFDCTEVGTQSVTLTGTDVNGNSNTCTATVTVEDNVAPDMSCQNTTVQLDDFGNGSITVSDVDNGSSDACGIQDLILSQTSFDCTEVGTQSVTLTGTDVNGNSNTCTATVTVEDNIAPDMNCQNTTVQLDASGNGSITVPDINNGSSDACGIQTLSLSQTSFDCTEVGTQSVTLTVGDVNGNGNTCTATVTVEDNITPDMNCQNTTVQLDASGNGSITVSDINNGSSDACGIQTLSLSQTSFDCTEVGTQSVTLTGTDVNGNSNTCTATVTVEDNIAPDMICQNTTVQLDASGTGMISVSDIDNGSSDACGIQTLSLNQTTFDCSEVGDQTITLTGTDNNGNVASCNATVSVQDNVNPIALCKNKYVKLDAQGNGSIIASDIDNGSNDACGIANLTASQTAFDCSHVGPNMIILTVEDNNGNENSCPTTVTILDYVPPMAICQNLTVVLDPGGNALITPQEVDNGSNDACGIADLSLDVTDFTCDDLGANPVILTVTDGNNNISSCSATITVIGGTALPSIWGNDDIDQANGDAVYDPCDEQFTLNSSGYSTPSSDEQHMVYQEICGDTEIIAHVSSINNPGWTGIQIRESLASGAKMVYLKTQLGLFVRRAARTSTGGTAFPKQILRNGHSWLKLVRSGNNFIGYTSTNGTNWSFAFSVTISMDNCAYVGLFTESNNAGTTTTAEIDNVSVTGTVNGFNAAIQLPADINAEGKNGFDFNIFPNPISNVLNIEFNTLLEDTPKTIEILDINGSLVYSIKQETDMLITQIDLEALNIPSGVYLLNIRNDGEVMSKRFVKN